MAGYRLFYIAGVLLIICSMIAAVQYAATAVWYLYAGVICLAGGGLLHYYSGKYRARRRREQRRRKQMYGG